jgi:hypothetical protein
LVLLLKKLGLAENSSRISQPKLLSVSEGGCISSTRINDVAFGKGALADRSVGRKPVPVLKYFRQGGSTKQLTKPHGRVRLETPRHRGCTKRNEGRGVLINFLSISSQKGEWFLACRGHGRSSFFDSPSILGIQLVKT